MTNIIRGSSGNDSLTGTSGSDEILTYAGEDIVQAGDGDDYINSNETTLWANSGQLRAYGGNGNDKINATDDGDDKLYGEDGDDTLYGRGGNDTLDGGQGDDTLYGGEGDDTLDGGEGNDYFYDHSGNDTLYGRGGDDQIMTYGGSNALVYGGSGNDLINTTATSYYGTRKGTLIAYGEEGDDRIAGGDGGSNKLYGGVGDDTLWGNDGDDTLDGGEGDDTLYGSGGKDVLTGGLGADYLSGEDGDDTLDGSEGDDTLYGRDGDDTLDGGEGDDTLWGNDGGDTLDGGEGDDTLWGNDGDDTLDGGEGDDRLYGGAGSNILTGGKGSDYFGTSRGHSVVYAGDGNDFINSNEDSRFSTSGSLEAYGGSGNDKIQGAEGDDTLDGGEGDDTLYGSGGIDTLTGGLGVDYLSGGDGDDTLDGGEGDDTLYGRDGDDTLDGGEGDDTLWGNDGDDTLDGSEGDDTLYGRDGDDTLDGGEGDDTLWGNDGDDTLDGGEGDDTLYGSGGIDTLTGSLGADFLSGGDGDDTLGGDEGDDKLYGRDGGDTLDGGEGDDTLWGNDGNDTLDGGEGDDTLSGNDGDDALDGGEGDDTLYGSGGIDTLTGGFGADYLSGGDGDDTLDGGEGDDKLHGGAGDDKFYYSNGSDEIFGSEGEDSLTLYVAISELKDFEYNGLDVSFNVKDNKVVTRGIENYYFGNDKYTFWELLLESQENSYLENYYLKKIQDKKEILERYSQDNFSPPYYIQNSLNNTISVFWPKEAVRETGSNIPGDYFFTSISDEEKIEFRKSSAYLSSYINITVTDSDTYEKSDVFVEKHVMTAGGYAASPYQGNPAPLALSSTITSLASLNRIFVHELGHVLGLDHPNDYIILRDDNGNYSGWEKPESYNIPLYLDFNQFSVMTYLGGSIGFNWVSDKNYSFGPLDIAYLEQYGTTVGTDTVFKLKIDDEKSDLIVSETEITIQVTPITNPFLLTDSGGADQFTAIDIDINTTLVFDLYRGFVGTDITTVYGKYAVQTPLIEIYPSTIIESYTGHAGTDQFILGSIEVQIDASTGDDYFYVYGVASSVINGGSGDDSIYFSNAVETYTISGEGITVNIASEGATYALTSIEKIYFDNKLFVKPISVTSERNQYNEGDIVYFVISNLSKESGSKIRYTLSGISESDLQSGSLSGTAIVSDSGTTVISLPLASDALTEGVETLTITLDEFADKTESVIINDTSKNPGTVTTTHLSSILVDKNVLGASPTMLEGLTENIEKIDGIETNHVFSFNGLDYDYNDISPFIMIVVRDNEFTNGFRSELADFAPEYKNLSYQEAVDAVGLVGIYEAIITVAGADGNYIG